MLQETLKRFNPGNVASQPTSSVIESENAFDSAATMAVAEDPYPWILHPVLDILFCCGGFLCIVLVAILFSGVVTEESLYGSGGIGYSLLVLNTLGQFLIASAHQPATLWRVYVSKSTRERLGTFVTVSGIIALAIGVVGLFNKDLTAWLVRITLAWSVQHTLAQAYGVSLIYCFKRKYFMTPIERRIFFYLFQTAIVYLILRMFTYSTFCQGDLYGLMLPVCAPVPTWICDLSFLALQLNAVLFAGMIIGKWMKTKVMFPFPALATTLMGLAVMGVSFLLPPVFLIFIPTFYHASQYVVVTLAYYLKERGLPPDVSTSNISSMLTKEVVINYLVVIAAVGAILYIGLPRLLYELHFDKSICLCIVYSIFNLHHYITDAAIWRMRDPKVRKLLVA